MVWYTLVDQINVQSIGNFSTGLVNALVTKQFTEWTESALSLNSECLQAPQPGPAQADPQLESAIWTNRTTFELLQGSSAPYQASILNVWNTCETVIMRWKLTDTGSRPVNGIIVLETVPVSYAYLLGFISNVIFCTDPSLLGSCQQHVQWHHLPSAN